MGHKPIGTGGVVPDSTSYTARPTPGVDPASKWQAQGHSLSPLTHLLQGVPGILGEYRYPEILRRLT